jgi:DNA-binding transcriptional LysR family regulator
MDVRVQDLRYFVAVAEELSFTRAAERVFVSQPALSKQVRHLETTLRVRLFERDHRRVALTAAGAALLPQAREIVEIWDGAYRAVAEAAVLEKSTLTVGCQTRIDRNLIPATKARMQEVLPGWQLRFRQLSWDDPTAGLCRGETDVAIAWLPVPGDAELTSRVVSVEDRWVALPPGHRLATWEVVPFAELVREPFIALPASAGRLREFWLAGEHRSAPARVSAEAETAEETFEAVSAGAGVVLVAAENTDLYQRGGVICRPVAGISPCQLAVVWRANDKRQAVRVFADVCVACLCAGS